MKKIIVFAFVTMFAAICIAGNYPHNGSWKTENIVYTFNKDTLYIDEIGIEGDCYTCSYSGDTVIAQNEFNKLKFVIKHINDNKINVKCIDDENVVESFDLKKITEYNFYDM